MDNAPIESFFGHLKDEAELRDCNTYEELVAEIDRYIKYYNNERPQWDLKGKTPAECRGFT
ncbi:ISCpe6, transposase orfB [Bdellovibrio bacteriovorus W]|nr:ISCpe6, transposase orfB [Bdellovibrio bacteriovorus W]